MGKREILERLLFRRTRDATGRRSLSSGFLAGHASGAGSGSGRSASAGTGRGRGVGSAIISRGAIGSDPGNWWPLPRVAIVILGVYLSFDLPLTSRPSDRTENEELRIKYDPAISPAFFHADLGFEVVRVILHLENGEAHLIGCHAGNGDALLAVLGIEERDSPLIGELRDADKSPVRKVTDFSFLDLWFGFISEGGFPEDIIVARGAEILRRFA